MQIIIPMTGNGSRFQNAGYKNLKPFIKVEDKPMIEWVVKMFPGDDIKIIFICRETHLNSLNNMEKILKDIRPDSNIYIIKDWQKKGPVYDVLLASKVIEDTQPVLISYCDYYMHWDFNVFRTELAKRNCDGAVPCYSGFHPHLLPKKNLYASCKVDEKENLVEIKEKYSWEDDKTLSRHSPGAYYFKTGALMKKYCKKLIDAEDHINGEYYASLPYNYMVMDKLKIWCPVIVTHFCQWGTPEDLEDYLFWTSLIKGFTK
jgi:NDP-sugar pyrophosphorylase family protein